MRCTPAPGRRGRRCCGTAGPECQEHAFPWPMFGRTDGSDVMGVAIVGGPTPGRFELFVDQVEMR